jgi:xylan 1,4-beta-xylosidase
VAEYSELFHGGHGLFTRNGIKKPPYYGLEFLAKLKDHLIAKEDEFIATKSDDGTLVAVMSNYIHLNDLYAHGQLSTLTNERRYDAFQAQTAKNLFVRFSSLPAGNYLVEEEYVNQSHGSAFDQWMKMTNGLELPDPESEAMLKIETHPSFRLHRVSVAEDGLFKYEVTLQPHEIRLMRLKKEE